MMNPFKISSLLLSAIFVCFSVSANPTPEPAPTGSIGGMLLEQGSNDPIGNMTVFVFKENASTPIKVVNTDEKGVFIFSDMLPGEYRIEASFLGFLPFEDVVQVLANQKTQLGKITLKANSRILKSFEITGRQSTMKMDVDKKVFTVDQNVAAAGASTSDILKEIPSVEVDAEGGISLRNSSNVIIWINGKPSGLTAENRAQVLEQMPAESIDRVEVVTNPSSKFSAEGSAGIINIVLKKDRKAGYYGSLRLGLSNPFGYNLGANINYSNPKWDLYGSIGRRANTNQGSGTTFRETATMISGVPSTSYMNSITNREGDGSGNFLRAGADYHINAKHTIGLSGFYMDGDRNNDNRIEYQYLNSTRDLTKEQIRKSNSNGNNNNAEITLDYQWEIGEEHNLQAIVSGGNRSFPSHSGYEQIDYDGNHLQTNTFFQTESGEGSEKELEFQLDYAKKISDLWKFELGWKSTLNDRTSKDEIFNGMVAGSGTPALSNMFNYKEQQHAAYGTLTGKINEKIGYQMGLRAENAIIHFESTDELSNTFTSRDKDYLKLFPTFFINYQLDEQSDIQFNYSRRINRPRGRALNPFVNISDSTNIWQGNPDLDPEFAHSFELNFLKAWKRSTLSASVYHRLSDQVIQDIRYINNGIMFQTPQNVTNSGSTGLEMVSKNTLFKDLETTSTFNLYHQYMDAFSYLGRNYPSSRGLSWNFRVNGQWLLPKSFVLQASGFYSAPRIVAQGKMDAAYSMGMGIRKSMWDKKLQIALNAQNILNSFKFENETTGPGFRQVTSNKFFSRSLRLNITYNFGNLKPKMRSERNEEQPDQGMDMNGGEY